MEVRYGTSSSATTRARGMRGHALSETACREPFGTASGGSDGRRASGRTPPPRRTREGNKKVRSGLDAPWASSHAMVSATTRGTPPHPSLHASRRGAPNTGIVGGSGGVREGNIRARAFVPNGVRREKRLGERRNAVFRQISPKRRKSSSRFVQRWRRASRASPRAPPRSAPSCSTGTCVDVSPVLPAPPPKTRRPPSRSTWCCIATRGFPGRTRLATTFADRRAVWAR